MKRQLAIGINDFRELREEGYYYVDKTLLVRDFIVSKEDVSLITRPSRFGKTLNLTMLREFFDISKDSTNIFYGLEIMETKYGRRLNALPVIFLTFENCTGETLAVMKRELARAVRIEYERFVALFGDAVVQEATHYHKFSLTYEMLKGDSATDAILESSLSELMEAVYTFYGKRPIVLIDDYDQPLMKSYEKGYYGAFAKFYGRLLDGALRKNEFLQQSLLIGTHPVTADSFFSGLKAFPSYDVSSEQYAQYFGLTIDEAIVTAAAYGTDASEIISGFYNGYIFGGTRIYNPWSLLHYIDRKELKKYWENVSTSILIRTSDENELHKFAEEFGRLLSSGEIMTRANLKVSLATNILSEVLWGMLVNAGYLTIVGVDAAGRSNLKVPNLEAREVIRQIRESYTSLAAIPNVIIPAIVDKEVADVKIKEPVKSEAPVKAGVPVKTEASAKAEKPAKSGVSVKAEVPRKVEEFVKAEAPAKAEKTAKVEAPVKAEASAKLEAPAKAEKAAKAEAPAKPEKAAKVETPVKAEAPAKLKVPVKEDVPVKVEAPVKVEKPEKLKEPVKVESPAKAKEPLKVESPAKVESPGKVKEPVKVEAPVKVREPVKVESPVKAKDPVKTESPVKVKEPAKAEAPTKVKEPVKVEAPAKVEASTKVKEPVKVEAPVKAEESVKVEWPEWAEALRKKEEEAKELQSSLPTIQVAPIRGVDPAEIQPSIIVQEKAREKKAPGLTKTTDKTATEELKKWKEAEPKRESKLKKWKEPKLERENKLKKWKEPESEWEIELKKWKESEPEGKIELKKWKESEPEGKIELKKWKESEPEGEIELGKWKEPEPEGEIGLKKLKEPEPEGAIELRKLKESEPGEEIELKKLKEPEPEREIRLKRESETELARAIRLKKENETELAKAIRLKKESETKRLKSVKPKKMSRSDPAKSIRPQKERRAKVISKIGKWIRNNLLIILAFLLLLGAIFFAVSHFQSTRNWMMIDRYQETDDYHQDE